MLSVFQAEHPEVLPPPGAPLRAGEPVGEHRLHFMFGSLRSKGTVRVRGRREPLLESPVVHLAPGEWYAYAVVGPDHLRYMGPGPSFDLFCAEILYTPTPSEAEKDDPTPLPEPEESTGEPAQPAAATEAPSKRRGRGRPPTVNIEKAQLFAAHTALVAENVITDRMPWQDRTDLIRGRLKVRPDATFYSAEYMRQIIAELSQDNSPENSPENSREK